MKSFDDLPIPFRCVSTELISKKAHVFSSGPIGQAMRSSMSLPAIFAPVRDGDHVYVDGALVDNLPTDLAREMGPDVVIAIHLQVAPTTADEIQSLFSVLGQSITVGVAATELRGMEEADIVVKVDVQKFTSLDFNKAHELIQKGWEAAEEKSKILLPYSLDQAAWNEYVARRDARKKGAVGIPQFVRVDGTTHDAEQKIQKFLQPLVGKPIDPKILDTYLTRLTGIGRFESASYGLTENDGQLGLLVTVREKNYAPPVLQPAIAVDGTEPDNVTFTMGGRLTFLDIAGYGSELRTDFTFGNTYGISTELYKTFTPTTRWFFAPTVSASDSAQWIFSYNNPQADYRLGRAEFGTDLGYAVSRFSEVRAGYEIGYLDAKLKLGYSAVPIGQGASRALHDFASSPTTATIRSFHARVIWASWTFHWMDTSPGAPAAFPNLESKTEFFKVVSDRLLSSCALKVALPRLRQAPAFLNTSSEARPGCLLWRERGPRKSVLPFPRGIPA